MAFLQNQVSDKTFTRYASKTLAAIAMMAKAALSAYFSPAASNPIQRQQRRSYDACREQNGGRGSSSSAAPARSGTNLRRSRRKLSCLARRAVQRNRQNAVHRLPAGRRRGHDG